MDTNVRINCETNGFEEEEYNMAQNIIGERIAGLLREQGKTQRELAEQVGTTEVSMSRYIKGDRVPNGPILANIAKALHTTTDYLVGNKKDSNDPEIEITKPMESKWIRADRLWERIAGSAFFSTEEKMKIRFVIDTEPEIVVERKKGKWERGYSLPDGEYDVKCTVCGEIIKCIYPMHYCPNCGSFMKGELE